MPAGESGDIPSFKVILLGDATVGKTHIVSRITRGLLPSHPKATIGVEFATHVITLDTGEKVKAQLWDTAGQERYRSVTAAHYRRAVGGLIVYDITKAQTFVNAVKWVDAVKQHSEPDIFIVVLGNKSDLVEENPNSREVQFSQAKAFADRNGFGFFETSAVADVNLKEAFRYLMHGVSTASLKSLNSTAPTGEGGLKFGHDSKFVDDYNSNQGGLKLTDKSMGQNNSCCGLEY